MKRNQYNKEQVTTGKLGAKLIHCIGLTQEEKKEKEKSKKSQQGREIISSSLLSPT